MPKEIRRRKRGQGRGSDTHGDRLRDPRRKVIWAWSIVLLSVVLGFLGFVLMVWLRGQMQRSAGKAGENAGSEVQVRVASRFQSPSEPDALDLVRKALAVREPEEVGRFFRLGSADSKEVVGFLSKRFETDGKIAGYEWLSSMDANGMLIDGVLVNTLLEDQPRNRLALLTPDDEGTWRVDFEAFARSVVPEWPVLLDSKCQGGRVRVVTSRDSYFNGPFSSEADWACYAMASPDMNEILVGYCRRGSPQAKAMERVMIKPGDEHSPVNRSVQRVTLEIRRAEGGESRQFEITRVLAEDWIVSDTAFDGMPLPQSAPL
jgi:hypothetical protein